MPADKERFKQLIQQWRSGQRYTSSVSEMVLDMNYQRIIAMGPEVVPWLIDELQSNPDHYFFALCVLTGVNPVAPEDAGNFAAMRTSWLDWWNHHREQFLRSIRHVPQVEEAKVSKGGQNPPLEEDANRPPPPDGSGRPPEMADLPKWRYSECATDLTQFESVYVTLTAEKMQTKWSTDFDRLISYLAGLPDGRLTAYCGRCSRPLVLINNRK